MQLENRSECANGDVGKVIDIDTQKNTVTVKYVESTVVYEHSALGSQLSLAYAMSIHKSQGSEYDCVISCLCSDHKNMLIRNLLYTAVTRAKKKYIHCGDKEALEMAIKNEQSCQRITMLVEKISYLWKKYLLSAWYSKNKQYNLIVNKQYSKKYKVKRSLTKGISFFILKEENK